MSSLNKRSISYPEASLTLALSAAEGRLLMALGRCGPGGVGAELLCAQEWQATAQGVELLTPALDSALRALKLTPRHIGRIAAVNGPGSFTGLRLSIISAAGLARAIGAMQAGIPYLPLLASYAYTWWRELAPGAEYSTDAKMASEHTTPKNGTLAGTGLAPEFWAVTYARRDLVQAQGFTLSGVALAPTSDILVLGLEEAAARLAGRLTARPCLTFGSGIARNCEFFAAALAGKNVRLLGQAFEQPSPGFLLQAALEAEYGEANIAPLYVRQSDAEENLPQISAKLGRDSTEAKAALQNILNTPPKNQI